MEKNRLILATALSFIVLIGWSYFFAPKEQPKAPGTEAAVQQAAPQPPVQPTPLPSLALVASKGQSVGVSTPLYSAKLNSHGGLLESFLLKQYRQGIETGSPNVELVTSQAMLRAPLGLLWSGQPTWAAPDWSFEGQPLELSGDQTGTLRFVCDLAGVRLVRELTFRADSYVISETVRVQPMSGQALAGKLGFTLAATALSGKDDSYNPTRVEWLAKDSLESEADAKDLEQGIFAGEAVGWGGLSSNYFLLALAPGDQGWVFKAKLEEGLYRMAVEKDGVAAQAGGEAVVSAAYFLGPKDPKLLVTAGHGLEKSVDYGTFSFVAQPLLWLLDIFHGWTANWGVAIILLTVLIKIVFWPLSQKSYVSMQKMKKLQPMMAKIREKHGSDREKMNAELMQLYKTYKVNPMGGCLPMLLQIPVFFGLYQALLLSLDLRHAAFITHVPFTNIIWLADLSAKDPFYVTPLIMGATMFLQQKMSPPPGDPTQAKIMLFMPVIFTGLFLNFPAGLVVYWLVNNVLSIFQQWLLMRKS